MNSRFGATTNSERAPFEASDGSLLIGAARESISNYFSTRRIAVPQAIQSDPRFDQKLGCFVTLKQDDEEKSLRGCIGFPEPLYKLQKALPQAAIAAATEDPRFPPVKSNELDLLLAEVSILTTPILIAVKSQKELLSEIELGKDGLIMRWSFGSGLLLPQVATEYKWDIEQYLCNLSMKAGAPADQWLVPGTLVYKFQALIFQEETPRGDVIMSRG